MKPNLPFIFTVIVGILASLFYNLRGPDYSESPAGIPPWPIFKVATRVGEFFRSSHLASNPGGLLFLHHGISYTSATSLYVIAKLGVADVIKDKQIDYEEIALAVNVLPEKLYRVIRYLSSEGVFNLNGKLVSLTAEGQFLRSDRDDSMRWCLIHMNEETAESMHSLLEEVKTGKEAFESRFEKNIFDLYEERPSSAEAFTKCMSGMFSGLINPPTTAEYDFSQHKVLLDFGGGRGYASFEILKQHNSVAKSKSQLTRAIVFDLEKVVTHANKTLHHAIEVTDTFFFDL